jgi:hypothetical protein
MVRRVILSILLALGAGGTMLDATKNIGFGMREFGICEAVTAIAILLGGLALLPTQTDRWG